MATPKQIAQQVALERDQIKHGLNRLRNNTKQLEDKSYASATIYGVASIDTLLPLVVERLNTTFRYSIKSGKNGVAFKEVHKYLSDIEPLALAGIACKVTFDKVFSTKKDSNKAGAVCEAIGRAVEEECQMRHYESNAPGLLETLKKNYWHKSIGTHQKIVVIRTLMNRYNVEPFIPWGPALRTKLGAWLLEAIMTSSQWFDKQLTRKGRKTTVYVVPTPEFLEIKDQVMANAELFSPLAWPMLIEPNDWSNERPGGYLLNEVMKAHKMVRRRDDGPIQGETPITFLNKIQKVGYRLNPFVIEVAETLEKAGISVGKFIPIVEIPLPPKPVDIADNEEARMRYRRAAAEVMNTNASAFRRSCRTRMTMEAVRRFKDKDEFFIPWSFDYRGRAYPIPSFLTPQDSDFGKSLIRFSNESMVTPEAKEWLSFQVSTTYGNDKDTREERHQWTNDNITLISRVALDPIDSIGDWEIATEPFQFLAACDEYYHCVIKGDRDHTGLMVAIDATCSGLQILAGLARDRSTAELVNVLPSDRPQDAYAKVAGVAKWSCPKSVENIMDRKVVKRTVMTIPYNAKPYSNRSYIKDALKEKGIEISTEDLTQTVQAVRTAMSRVVPGPMSVMKWIEDEVTALIKKGEDELEWETPSGFVVKQRLMKKVVETLRLQLLGRCELEIATEDGDKVDINRHKAATAPNLIHSLDASLLHLAVARFNNPIALIHDSVLCRATDMSVLDIIVRETYMKLFSEHDYLKTFGESIEATTEPPIIGDLKPETVIKSTYFFC